MKSASPASAWPSPGHDDRIKRNVACVNCRNSKVRCKQNPISGQPCQRCAKLDLSCVVDKSHKRITKRSKLDKLEQELDAIKQAVRPRPSESPRPPRSPRASYHTYPEQSHPSISHSQPRSTFHLTPTSIPENQPVVAGSSSGLTATARRPIKDVPTQARTIGNCTVSGEDIDHYFDRYLECFHPYVPIVRKRDPDLCYEASPVLFWVIVFVACRRYARQHDIVSTLVEHLTKEIWAIMATPIMSIEDIHALLLMCAWPLPTVRFATDPSTTFAALAMNVCMLMGLHTGRGTHPEFCVGSRQNVTSTDEEASSTFIAACIFAQQTAAASGHPPPSIQLNDNPAKRALRHHQWDDLLFMFDVQKYLNRLHTAMASQITNNGSVVENVVSAWEDEFEALKPVLVKQDSKFSRFILLMAQQQIQQYYFHHPLDNPGPNYALHATRALTTSKALIATALALESSSSRFLTYAPQWAYRAVTEASAFLVSALRSSHPPPLDHHAGNSIDPADQLVQQCYSAMMAWSTSEGDLAFRGATLMLGFWSCRDQVLASDLPVMAWTNRLAAGVAYWCLYRFNTALQGVQRNSNSESAANFLRVVQQPYKVQDKDAAEKNDDNRPQTKGADGPDPFQEVDWSAFMDDFGWGTSDSVFMGLP